MPSDAVDHLVSEVARNEIWREHIRKENSTLASSANRSSFRLDMKKLSILSSKPNHVNPHEKLERDPTKRTMSLPPQAEAQLFGVMPSVTAQKEGIPTTASQEYG